METRIGPAWKALNWKFSDGLEFQHNGYSQKGNLFQNTSKSQDRAFDKNEIYQYIYIYIYIYSAWLGI